jgi:hypothetical protein
MLFEMEMMYVPAESGQRASQTGHPDDSSTPFLDEPDPATYLRWLRPHLPRLLAVGDKANPRLVDHETARDA